MTSTTHVVTGLTCAHCVRAIAEEVGALPGVTGVDLDAASGRLTVTADRPVAAAQLRDAVEEAGYTLTT